MQAGVLGYLSIFVVTGVFPRTSLLKAPPAWEDMVVSCLLCSQGAAWARLSLAGVLI